MKSLILLGCLIIAALIITAMLAAVAGKPNIRPLRDLRRALGLHAGILRVNALTSGTHASGVITRAADAAMAQRYLLVKAGSDAQHFALGTAADEPLGICLDEPGLEDYASIQLLGAGKGTVLMVGSEAIDPGKLLFAAANGKVQDLPTVAGNYWLVGKSVDACSGDGDDFEVIPYPPTRVSIVANNADIAALKAAITSPSLVMALGA